MPTCPICKKFILRGKCKRSICKYRIDNFIQLEEMRNEESKSSSLMLLYIYKIDDLMILSPADPDNDPLDLCTSNSNDISNPYISDDVRNLCTTKSDEEPEIVPLNYTLNIKSFESNSRRNIYKVRESSKDNCS